MHGIGTRLPRKLNREYRRALGLRGATISEALYAHVRQFIKQTRELYPEAFEQEQPLTPNEEAVLEAIEEGNYEAKHIAEYTELSERSIGQTLRKMMTRGLIEERAQGGKTERGRGGRKVLYVKTKGAK